MGLFAIVVFSLWLLGLYRVVGVNGWTVMIGALAGALTSAFVQEIFFRGVLFRIAEERIGTWWALAGSAILFGLLHLIGPTATLLSVTGIALQAGVLLAAAYLVSRRLWLPIGLHAAWDFANDGILVSV